MSTLDYLQNYQYDISITESYDNINTLALHPFARTHALLSSIIPEVNNRYNLTVGQPKVPPPEWLKIKLYENNQWSCYPPVSGTIALQQAIRQWLIFRFDIYHQSNFLDTEPVSGAREGLFLLAMATRFLSFCHKKGKVLIGVPNPGYAVYAGSAYIAGASLLSLNCPQGIMPYPNSLDKQVLHNLQLVFLCNPDNPSGQIQSDHIIASWIEAARQYNFLLVVDECYSELYLEHPPTGVLKIAAHIDPTYPFNNVVCVNSLSKRSSAAGLRSGLIAGDKEIIDVVRKIKSYAGNRMPMALQNASVALWHDEIHVKIIRDFYRQNYLLCREIFGLINSKNTNCTIPIKAGMFLWLRVKDDLNAAKLLWQKAGISTIPGRYLCLKNHTEVGKKYLRIALVDSVEILRPILLQIRHILEELI